MLKLSVISLIVLLLAAPLLAQQPEPADYSIRNIRSRLSEDTNQFIIEFEVINEGGDATVEASAELAVIQTGETLSTETVAPLLGTEITTVRLPFALDQFPPGSEQSLRVAVGIDEVEANGSVNIRGNFAQISVTIPGEAAPPGSETLEATPTPEATAGAGLLSQIGDALPFDVDTDDPAQRAVLGGLAIAVVVLLFIIIIIIRLIFQRTPSFGIWQPPYAEAPQHDPNSPTGRRQLWQKSATNNTLPVHCSDGSAHIRKLLLGMDGSNLSGWRVSAIRLSQYDMYGRVSRSQVLASAGVVKRLNRVAKKHKRAEQVKIMKQVRPVAKSLANSFRKKLNQRNAMLPIAFDLRIQGIHGDVRIVFELYQCHNYLWHRIDQWEPEMVVTSKAIQESYSYPLYGQRPEESFKVFRQRLQDDLVKILTTMIQTSSTDRMAYETPSRPMPPIGDI